jgi:hypothetical protein
MVDPLDSQVLESYVPVYDAAPQTWEAAQPFIVEQLKRLANAINIREIGWFLDEELLSGKAFIPGTNNVLDQGSQTSQNYRSILRKVVNVSPLVAGLNPPFLHGITFDNNFTLIDLWVAGTNSTAFLAQDISGNDVLMNATQLIITSPQAFDRAFAVIEYIQEL